MNENRIQMAKTLFYIYFAQYILVIKLVYVFALCIYGERTLRTDGRNLYM